MRITTADKILVAALLILNGWLFANWGTGFSKGDWVVVTVNQKETIRLPLNQDQITHVKGPLGLTEIEVKKRTRPHRSLTLQKQGMYQVWIHSLR